LLVRVWLGRIRNSVASSARRASRWMKRRNSEQRR
jgi:hypothetical protein